MATTWSNTDALTYKAACTTGSESAPTLVTEGMPLSGVKYLQLHANAAAPMTAGGTLDVYLWNPVAASWDYASELTRTLAGGVNSEAFQGLKINSYSRLAVVPNGVGVAVDIHLIGTRR